MSFLDTAIKKIENNNSSQVRISSIEGLRALSVTFVFFVHYTTLIEPWIDKGSFGEDRFKLLRLHGNYGVELFFIISGYLIYSIVIRNTFKIKSFIVKRVQRIYPTFVAVLAIYLALCFLVPSESKLPSSLYGRSIYLLQNLLLLPGMLNIKPLITVSWTLSFEIFFYLALPGLVSLSGIRNFKSERRLLILAMSLLIYLVSCIVLSHPISRISAFALGCLAFETKGKIPNYKFSAGLGFLFLALNLISTYLNIIKVINYNTSYLISIASLFLFYVCVMSSHNVINKILSDKYARWYGNVSYSYFLFHGLCLKMIFFVLSKYYPPHHDSVLIYYIMAPLCFVVTVIWSTFFYLYIEYPYSLENPIRDYEEFQGRFKLYLRRLFAAAI